MLFTHCLLWLKNWRFSTNSCKRFIVPLKESIKMWCQLVGNEKKSQEPFLTVTPEMSGAVRMRKCSKTTEKCITQEWKKITRMGRRWPKTKGRNGVFSSTKQLHRHRFCCNFKNFYHSSSSKITKTNIWLQRTEGF